MFKFLHESVLVDRPRCDGAHWHEIVGPDAVNFAWIGTMVGLVAILVGSPWHSSKKLGRSRTLFLKNNGKITYGLD